MANVVWQWGGAYLCGTEAAFEPLPCRTPNKMFHKLVAGNAILHPQMLLRWASNGQHTSLFLFGRAPKAYTDTKLLNLHMTMWQTKSRRQRQTLVHFFARFFISLVGRSTLPALQTRACTNKQSLLCWRHSMKCPLWQLCLVTNSLMRVRGDLLTATCSIAAPFTITLSPG